MRRSVFRLGASLFAIFLALCLLRFLLAAAFPSPVVAYMTLESGLPTVIAHDLHHNLKNGWISNSSPSHHSRPTARGWL